MSAFTDQQNQFYRLLSALQELAGVSDAELGKDKELQNALSTFANVLLQVRTLGPAKHLDLRLKQRGLRVLSKPSLRIVEDPTPPTKPTPA